MSLTSLKEILRHMDYLENGAPIFDENVYVICSVNMKWYLQSAWYDLWISIVNGYVPPKKVKSIT